MSGLRKNAARLLKVVENKPHATRDDHVEEARLNFRSPHSASSDVDRDPDSSSDEDTAPTEISSVSPARNYDSVVKSTKTFTKPRATSNAVAKVSKGSRQAGTKRNADDIGSAAAGWMGSSQTRKVTRKYGSQQSQPHGSSNSSFKKPKIGPETESKSNSGREFKRPNHDTQPTPRSSNTEPKSSQNGFVRPAIAIPDWQTKDETDLDNELGTYIPSSPPSSPIEEVYIDGDNPALYETCPMCGATVLREFKTEWKLKYCLDKRMNLRMQERFCVAHKLEGANDEWKARAYPTVEWEDLPRRLRRHKRRIADILSGSRPSLFKDELDARTRNVKMRTVAKASKAVNGSGMEAAKAGYYGSRGAKLISDFVMGAFSGKLLALAAQDKSVAASGVAGGLSGFVQGVVVPELALALIGEDLGVDDDEARKVLDESSALGDLVHAEEEEKSSAFVATQAPVYGIDDTSRKKSR